MELINIRTTGLTHCVGNVSCDGMESVQSESHVANRQDTGPQPPSPHFSYPHPQPPYISSTSSLNSYNPTPIHLLQLISIIIIVNQCCPKFRFDERYGLPKKCKSYQMKLLRFISESYLMRTLVAHAQLKINRF
jgi:hypothetical protein